MQPHRPDSLAYVPLVPGRNVRPLYWKAPAPGGGYHICYSLHDGQLEALHAPERFILVLAGSQGGKTSFGPLWLYQEIRNRGPGDYLVAAPSFPLLAKKLLPEFRRFFEVNMRLGKLVSSPTPRFTMTKEAHRRVFAGTPYADEPYVETNVFFGHAQDAESLESATAKAAWLDEAGQRKFRYDSWEAIIRRLTLHQGRVLITTTPYYMGWLKTEVFDRCGKDPDYKLVQFESIMNPMFPMSEWKRLQEVLPAWKFNMFHRGRFERPAGLIYDVFTDDMVVEPFTIPEHWPRWIGIDFGAVNFAATVWAESPNGTFYLEKEYLAGGKRIREHVEDILRGIPYPQEVVGGARAEEQWREEVRAAGLHIREPEVTDVEVGIDRCYSGIKRGLVRVLKHNVRFLDEIRSYSREVDELGNPGDKIEDKESYHLLDSFRYIGQRMFPPEGARSMGIFTMT